MAYDLLGIRNRVKNKLQKDSLWSDDEVDESINLGLDQLLLFLQPTKEIFTANSNVGVQEMNLPDDLFFIYDVLYDGSLLRKTTYTEMLGTGVETLVGLTRRGVPAKWYFRQDSNNYYIGFDICPQDSKQVTVTCTRKFQDLAADTDEPLLKRALTEASIHWAVQDLLEKDVVESGSPNPTWRIQHHMQKYIMYRSEANSYLNDNKRRKVIRTKWR